MATENIETTLQKLEGLFLTEILFQLGHVDFVFSNDLDGFDETARIRFFEYDARDFNNVMNALNRQWKELRNSILLLVKMYITKNEKMGFTFLEVNSKKEYSGNQATCYMDASQYTIMFEDETFSFGIL
jgi:hypothetical protein